MIYQDRLMNNQQVGTVFYTVDVDNSGLVSDQEWKEFYQTFIEPFNLCDKDKDQKLVETELKDCLDKDESLSPLSDLTNLKELFFYMDRVDFLSFYEYLFMRRISKAIQ